MLRALDQFIVQAFVEAWETRRQAQEKLRNSPMLIKTGRGNIVTSPYARIVSQQNLIIRGLVAELGFSPAARTSIAIEEDDGPDPTDRFFE
ncbi:MAG: phage terminase small subunit P27 family [Pseudomonadota bacterium]